MKRKNISITTLLLFLVVIQVFADTKFYRASYRDDPSTTIVIGWCDDGTSTNAAVYYGTDDFSNMYNLYPNFHGIDRTQNHAGMTHRFARLTGLQPNTVYYLVIKDDQSTSTRMSFKTLPDDPNVPVMFISGGDTRTGMWPEFEYDQCRPRRQLGNQLVAKIRPDFIAFSGDFTFLGTDSEWSDWFTDWQQTIATATKNRLFACVPVYGNHEANSDLYNMFDIPNNSNYFAIDVGGQLMRLYNLNSDLECDASQLGWFEGDLQNYTGTGIEPYWKALQYHIPLVPHGEYTPQTSMINCWASLFPTYKIKLAMEGHTHIQKITNLISPSSGTGSDNGFITDTVNGTVFLGEGCWGAPLRDLYTYYSSSKAFNWTYAQDRFPGFSIVTVTKPYIKIQTVKFENVSSVGQVQETDPVTTLPTGLVFWSMAGSNEYYIYSSQTFSNDATLATLGTSQGTLDPVFSPATYNYTVELPAGTSNIPFTFATTSNINAGYTIDNAVNLNGSQSERTTTVTVTAENLVTSNTYTIEFILIGNSDATLNSLSSDMGTLNPSFYPQTTDYSVTLPPGTTQIPVVSATTNDPQATMIITQPTVADGEASVEVTSQDGTNTMTYTIDYTVASVSDKEITSFTIPNQTGQTSINQTTGEIVINMPITTDVTNLTPTISYIGEYVSPASGVAQNFTNPVTYIVTAADSSTKTYSAEVILTTSNDNANLATLSTNAGSLNPAFSSSVNNYTVAIDSTVTSAIITASAEDPNATIHIYHAADLQGNLAERTGIVLVIAADGVSTKTYSIIYADPSFVSEQYKEKNVKIFPNPTTGIVNIEFSSKTSENLKLRIYSGLGLFIESLNIKDKTYSVDISDYPNGTYFFLIKTNSDIIRYKIIKTH